MVFFLLIRLFFTVSFLIGVFLMLMLFGFLLDLLLIYGNHVPLANMVLLIRLKLVYMVSLLKIYKFRYAFVEFLIGRDPLGF